ncbi:MAG: hypothetical protein WDO71_12035 [Bacteroidota bacterium]
MLAINSASTPEGGIEAELVYAGKGSKRNWKIRTWKARLFLLKRI